MDNKKIDTLLKSKDIKYTDIAKRLGRFKQSIHNTKNKGTWTGDDLITIADLTNTELAFIDPTNKSIIISFSIKDLA